MVAGGIVLTRSVALSRIRMGGLAMTVVGAVVLINLARVPSRDVAGWLAGEMQAHTSVCGLGASAPAPRIGGRFHIPRLAQRVT